MNARQLFLAVTCLLLAVTVGRAETPPAAAASDAQAYQKAVDRAVEYLTKAQADDGSYSAQAGIGVTAIVTTALLRQGRSPEDPVVAKSLKYLEGFVQPDGAVCTKDSMVKNYETSLAVMAFHAANRNGRYDKLLKGADKYLKGSQWDEEEGQDRASYYYGGAGYGKHKRPDLSNTGFFLEALKDLGNGPNDPNVQKALVFVSRCQNLESPHNTTPYAAENKNPDDKGGFYYTPVGGGVSMANSPDQPAEQGLRSYGSMTYAGLKSMIYAGLGPDDPRVKAALQWIHKHYTVAANPGMGQQGLYYYYNTFAKALDAAGVKQIEDEHGVKHDWRAELRTAVVERQRANGSWLNDEKRWLESDPNLVTGYALLVLSYCKP